jgi:hypothetical protein
MPRKRRMAKARIDQSGELAAWRTTFQCGVTLDGQLEPVGIPMAHDRPTADEVEEAWHRLGERFIAAYGREWTHGNEGNRPSWALRKFGEP